MRGSDGHISNEFLAGIVAAVEAADGDRLAEIAEPIHEADLADILEALKGQQRRLFVQLLGSRFDFRSLTEVDDKVREEILDLLPTEAVVEGVRDLDTDDAVYILEDLDEADLVAEVTRLLAEQKAEWDG